MITFDKIVHKLSKKAGNVVLLKDIEELVDPENARGEGGKREVYKTIYRLKSEWRIFALRNGLFYVFSENSCPIWESEMVAMTYWKIVHAYVRSIAWSEAIIAGTKGLEFHLKDMSIPNNLIVYTKYTNKKIRIANWLTIHFRTVEKWEKKWNAFSILRMKHSVKSEIEEGVSLRFLTLEAALLDSLLIHRGMDEVDGYLARKFLVRFHGSIDRDTLGELVKIRYISSINRLREMAKVFGYDDLYDKTLSVIKNEWAGCFLTFQGTTK